MESKHKEPEVKREAGTNWAVASWPGSLYANETNVMSFLASSQVTNSASAKVATDANYTYVVFET